MGYRIVCSLMLSLALAVGLGVPPDAAAAGKDFVIGYLGDATSLNPVIATDGQSYIAEWPIFDSLVELDEKLGVKPLLAESWEVSRDGLTYTFKLKKGVSGTTASPSPRATSPSPSTRSSIPRSPRPTAATSTRSWGSPS